MDLIAKAKEEFTDIEQRIAEMVKRKNDLQAFIAAGERLFGSVIATEPSTQPRRRLAVVDGDEGLQQKIAASIEEYNGGTTKKAQIISAVEKVLVPGVRKQTRELVDAVRAMGVELPGDGISTISVLMSRDSRFSSERAKGGWGLAENNANQESGH
jgi:hypothetical protein